MYGNNAADVSGMINVNMCIINNVYECIVVWNSNGLNAFYKIKCAYKNINFMEHIPVIVEKVRGNISKYETCL